LPIFQYPYGHLAHRQLRPRGIGGIGGHRPNWVRAAAPSPARRRRPSGAFNEAGRNQDGSRLMIVTRCVNESSRARCAALSTAEHLLIGDAGKAPEVGMQLNGHAIQFSADWRLTGLGTRSGALTLSGYVRSGRERNSRQAGEPS
jgi:hypothetical protein